MLEHQTIKMKGALSILFIGLLMITSCYFDNEEDLYPFGDCNTADVTYAFDIQPLLEQECYQCHDDNTNFGQVNLSSYETARQFALNGRLFGAVNHDSGFSPMPKNAAKLANCDIQKIAVWINDGAPNN